MALGHGEIVCMSEQGMVVRLESAQAALRDHFLGWQCRLRQKAMRQGGGQPSEGMRPILVLPDDPANGFEVTVLIVPRESETVTAQFRHMARKTHDPSERYQAAIKLLASAHYQQARDFSDELTALFGPESKLAARLVKSGVCALRFEQYSQRYVLPCRVRPLAESDPAWQATYWHNSLFNREIPAGIAILGFQPDWATAKADPPVE